VNVAARTKPGFSAAKIDSSIRRSSMKRSIVSRTNLFTALAGVLLVFSGVAYGNGPVAAASSRLPKAKGGTLKISAAADVGAVTLEPGEYEVKQVNSPAGPVIRFTSVTLNPFAGYAEESLPPYWREVVAKVKVTMQPLASKATRTELRLASDGLKAVALQIRGNGFDYLF
jgi:hypothetical protein